MIYVTCFKKYFFFSKSIHQTKIDFTENFFSKFFTFLCFKQIRVHNYNPTPISAHHSYANQTIISSAHIDLKQSLSLSTGTCSFDIIEIKHLSLGDWLEGLILDKDDTNVDCSSETLEILSLLIHGLKQK